MTLSSCLSSSGEPPLFLLELGRLVVGQQDVDHLPQRLGQLFVLADGGVDVLQRNAGAGQRGDQLVELVVDPFAGGQVDRLPEDATAFSRSSVLLDFSYRWASVSSDCSKAANSRRSRSWLVGRLLLVLVQVG